MFLLIQQAVNVVSLEVLAKDWSVLCVVYFGGNSSMNIAAEVYLQDVMCNNFLANMVLQLFILHGNSPELCLSM